MKLVLESKKYDTDIINSVMEQNEIMKLELKEVRVHLYELKNLVDAATHGLEAEQRKNEDTEKGFRKLQEQLIQASECIDQLLTGNLDEKTSNRMKKRSQ